MTTLLFCFLSQVQGIYINKFTYTVYKSKSLSFFFNNSVFKECSTSKHQHNIENIKHILTQLMKYKYNINDNNNKYKNKIYKNLQFKTYNYRV